ncbi:MAG: FecR domain-containing protein [Tannerella sp.]|jgi:ferric-dicitrate binding protein FerR (iron transport regulator)|nr:FecR domain-containing protein [Tannerella sp.]
MQSEEKAIRRLATLYWEGKIPLKDESILFEFISNDANREKYRQWEEEWRLSNEQEPVINRKWKQLQNRIRIRENSSSKTLFKRKIPLWRKLSAAAAIALLLITTSVSIYELTIWNHSEVFTVEAPRGEKSKLCLPDGSTIWINAGSQIQYTNQFNVSDRTVTLTGEAYFDVAKQNNRPFIVKLRDYSIEVKGTKFNVSSYNDEKYVTTSLMEGSVSLQYDGKKYAMKPGEMMKLDVREKTLSLYRTNVSQYQSWTEDSIEYDEISLGELLNRLSRQYDMQIHINPDVDRNKILSVSFNNRESIDDILYSISIVTSIQYKYEHNDIYVSKK